MHTLSQEAHYQKKIDDALVFIQKKDSSLTRYLIDIAEGVQFLFDHLEKPVRDFDSDDPTFTYCDMED